jgi:integrase
VNARDAGFTAGELSKWFANAIDEAGLPDECKMHGLRKTAAKTLAEVGCTAHEIMAMTGHKSLKAVERYTQAAAQKLLAKSAVHKLERNVNRTESAK